MKGMPILQKNLILYGLFGSQDTEGLNSKRILAPPIPSGILAPNKPLESDNEGNRQFHRYIFYLGLIWFH
jgi:hypothetical protein